MNSIQTSINTILDDVISVYDQNPRKSLNLAIDLKQLLESLYLNYHLDYLVAYSEQLQLIIADIQYGLPTYSLKHASLSHFKGNPVEVEVLASKSIDTGFVVKANQVEFASSPRAEYLRFQIEAIPESQFIHVDIYEETQLVQKLKLELVSPLHIKDLGL